MDHQTAVVTQSLDSVWQEELDSFSITAARTGVPAAEQITGLYLHARSILFAARTTTMDTSSLPNVWGLQTTYFIKKKKEQKVSWKHPQSKHSARHFIKSSIIVGTADQQDALITKAATVADNCWTAHHPFSSPMRMKIWPKTSTLEQNSSNSMVTSFLRNKTCTEILTKSSRTAVEKHWNQLKILLPPNCREQFGSRW